MTRMPSTPDRASSDLAVSRTIAGIAGPTMVAIGASEALTYRIWASNIAPLIYLNGVLLFVAGLAIVRAHNRWTRSWPVLVTLTGWLGIFAGLFRMFAPEVQQRGENAPTTIVTAILIAAVGLVLTFAACDRRVRQ
jgi:uncharacterized membrane protein YhaH (DUF805 family)